MKVPSGTGGVVNVLLQVLLVSFAFSFLAAARPAIAQTPDGETPAQKAECDALKLPGITPGLYDLCVAFCEAKDNAANEYESITQKEFAELKMWTPSGRILAIYNEKKDKASNGLDPDMPCILKDEPCPCWTEEEFATIGDGLTPGGAPARTYCGLFTQMPHNSGYFDSYYMQELSYTGWENFNTIYASDYDARAEPMTGFQSCYYLEVKAGTVDIHRNLSIQSGTLTLGQHSSCMNAMQTKRTETANNGNCTYAENYP